MRSSWERSSSSDTQNSRASEAKNSFKTWVGDAKIIALTETHADDSVPNSTFADLEMYSFFRKDRVGRKGGVAAY